MSITANLMASPCLTTCTFENGEPFIRKTYILCQQSAIELLQVKAFMDILKAAR